MLETLAYSALSFAVGILIGANNPVRVKLVAERVEDVTKEAFEKGVNKSVEELKALRERKGR